MTQLTNGISAAQNSLGPLSVSGGNTPATGKTAGSTRTLSSVGHQIDQASLSVAGGLAAQVSASSDVRLEKVAGLQKAIASGSYKVSSSDVAGKIIDSLLR